MITSTFHPMRRFVLMLLALCLLISLCPIFAFAEVDEPPVSQESPRSEEDEGGGDELPVDDFPDEDSVESTDEEDNTVESPEVSPESPEVEEEDEVNPDEGVDSSIESYEGESEEEEEGEKEPGASEEIVALGGDIVPLASYTAGTLAELKAALATASPIDVTLTANITLTETLWLGGKDVTISSSSGNTFTLGISASFAEPNASWNGRHFGINKSSDGTSSGKLTLNNVILDGTRTAGNGGGLFPAADCVVTLNNSTIQNCGNDSAGGAIYSSGGSIITLNNSTIKNCEGRAGSGGAIYATASSNVTLNDAIITECSATGSTSTGGAIYAVDSTVGIHGSKITLCQSGYDGGAIRATRSNVNLDGSSTIEGCSAARHGGGIWAEASTVVLGSTLGGASIVNCTAGVTGTDGATHGGGIYITGGAASATIAANSSIEGCSVARGSGGGIYSSSSQINLSGTIDGCVANGSNWYYGTGGGIYLNSTASLIMTGGTISNCEAKATDGNVNTGGNTATGAGIYLSANATAAISGTSKLENNTAIAYGGAIHVTNYNNLSTTADVQFSGNTARFYRVPSDEIVNNPSIYSCTAAQTVSPSSAQLEGRLYPLNNFDITYISYKETYVPNGGVDTLNSNSSDDFIRHIEVPFSEVSTPKTYTVRDSSNADFAFKKAGSQFACWANSTIYIPTHGASWFKTYNPGETSTLDATFYTHATTYPEKKYIALWEKQIVITNEIRGAYADKTQKRSITVSFYEQWGAQAEVGTPQTFNLADGESSIALTFYDSLYVRISEDVTTLSGSYQVLYQLDAGAETSYADPWRSLITTIPPGDGNITHAYKLIHVYQSVPITAVDDTSRMFEVLLGVGGALFVVLIAMSWMRKRQISQHHKSLHARHAR